MLTPGISPMAFALNNPVSLVDPTGLASETPIPKKPIKTGAEDFVPLPTDVAPVVDDLVETLPVETGTKQKESEDKGKTDSGDETKKQTQNSNADLLPIVPSPGLPDLPPINLPPDLLLPPIRNPKKENPKPYWHVTYTKFNSGTGETYVGRSHGYGLTPNDVVFERDRKHHKDKEGFGKASLDRSAHGFHGYLAIRGREQIMIDAFGGSWSDKGRGNTRSGNNIRGVSRFNPFAPAYYFFAKLFFP
jgi:hypothetical protein